MEGEGSILEVTGLEKSYGRNKVLKGVDLTVRKGEVIAIIGPSGCGKSTFIRCLNLLEEPDCGKIVYKGTDLVSADKKTRSETLKDIGMVFQQFNLFPHKTVMDNVSPEDAIMGEEIFGPILPVLTFNDIAEAESFVNSRPHPLALYLFTENKAVQKHILKHVQFGGGCINDTIIHLATSEMGFGGVGESGMGAYHGKKSFETFSHEKSIVNKSTWLDLPMRYQPYTNLNTLLLRMFLK